LPPRLLEEPATSIGSDGWVNHLAPMLEEYYRTRGWDEDGVPRQETLEALGLAQLVEGDLS